MKGNGLFVDAGDEISFCSGSSLPKQLLFGRPPKTLLFAISSPGYHNALRISSPKVDLTADAVFEHGTDGLAFIARKQTATIFDYSVDLSFQPTQVDGDTRVTIFLTQFQHIDLIIVNLCTNATIAPHLRWRVEASGRPNSTVPAANMVPLPKAWHSRPVRLGVEATTIPSSSSWRLLSQARRERYAWELQALKLFQVATDLANETCTLNPARPFADTSIAGTLIGAYASSNNGTGTTPGHFSRWRYIPKLQEIAAGAFVQRRHFSTAER